MDSEVVTSRSVDDQQHLHTVPDMDRLTAHPPSKEMLPQARRAHA